MSSVVTGEAVVLELRPATFAARAVSSFIDVFVQLVTLIALVLLVGRVNERLDPALSRALPLVLLVLVVVVLPVTVETLTRGKSLGRLVMGLRIVRDDGGAIRFRHAFIRGVVAVLEIYMLLGSLAFLVALFNQKSKRLGDILAGTYALGDRVAGSVPPRVYMPEPLQGWADLADIGRLPDPLSRRVSRFLEQAPRMAPQSRSRMAADLATETAAYVSPRPPLNTPPEEYLRAVVSERRDRDFIRLQRQRERSSALAERLHRLPYER